MTHPVFFAYTALFEVVPDAEPNLLVAEMMCSAISYPIHDDAESIFDQVKTPTEPGTYQVWATGTVVFSERPEEERAPRAEVRRSTITPASPACIAALVEAAREQQAAEGPKIEVYSEHDAAVVTSILGAGR